MNQARWLVFYNWLTMLLPDFAWARAVRVRFLRWSGLHVGANVEIGARVIIRGCGKIEFGNRVKVYDDVYILCKHNSCLVIEDDVIIGTRAYFESGGEIHVGKRTGIWQDSLVTANCGSKVLIGDDCKIAHKVSLKTTTHAISRQGPCIGGADVFKDIVIEGGAWLCAGAIVLPGVTIGHKCLVAAGAVVTRDAPATSLVAGIPAVIKKSYAE